MKKPTSLHDEIGRIYSLKHFYSKPFLGNYFVIIIDHLRWRGENWSDVSKLHTQSQVYHPGQSGMFILRDTKGQRSQRLTLHVWGHCSLDSVLSHCCSGDRCSKSHSVMFRAFSQRSRKSEKHLIKQLKQHLFVNPFLTFWVCCRESLVVPFVCTALFKIHPPSPHESIFRDHIKCVCNLLSHWPHLTAEFL